MEGISGFVCEVCESEQVDSELYAQFKVLVCYRCKETVNTEGENSPLLYSLITKSQGRNEYLLTDEELADSSLLPSITRKNPHNPRWSDMKLYLRKQVLAFAIQKYGSAALLQSAKDGRSDNRVDRKSKKFLKALNELRSKTRVEKKSKSSRLDTATASHRHSFIDGKCSHCGLAVQIEEL